MIEHFRVLLPKWIFEKAKNDDEIHAYVNKYMQRYPHYTLLKIENGFAVCDRIQMSKS